MDAGEEQERTGSKCKGGLRFGVCDFVAFRELKKFWSVEMMALKRSLILHWSLDASFIGKRIASSPLPEEHHLLRLLPCVLRLELFAVRSGQRFRVRNHQP